MIYDVVIVGAGPVGLFLAGELALAKCSVLVVERAEDADTPPKHIPFGIRGLSAPSVDALYRRGLLNQLEVHKRLKSPHQNSGDGQNRQVGHFAGIPIREGDLETAKWMYRLPSSPPANLISEMWELEEILSQRALSLGVEIRRGLNVTDFEPSKQEVKVWAGDQAFVGRWLVGCDGARSVIRKTGLFDFYGTEPEFTGYSASLELDDPDLLQPGRVITDRGMYLQSQRGYIVIQDFDGGRFHSTGQPVTLEHIQEVLQRVSGTDIGVKSLSFATTWTDRARQAVQYRKHRVLLAGDAAHIHSPLGGQGLNLGLGDAMNLGWKLAAEIHGRAPAGLLDTYQTERHPIGEAVLDWSRAQVAVMRPDPRSKALNSVLRDLLATRDGATYITERLWGIHLRYDLGGEHPLVGQSVPNFEFEDGTRLGELMHDAEGVLLDFASDDKLKTLAGKFKNLKYVWAKVESRFDLTAVLIRPDGIVAWVGTTAPDEGELQVAVTKWFST